MRYRANRSLLIDGRMYAKGDIIECAMKRGRATLFVKMKAIAAIDDDVEIPIVPTPAEETKTIVHPQEVAPKFIRKKA